MIRNTMSAVLFSLVLVFASGCEEEPTDGLETPDAGQTADAGFAPDATIADVGAPDLGVVDAGPEMVSGEIEICGLAGTVGVWTTNVYTNIPSEPGARPGHGAGLVDDKLIVGGDGDEYRTYFRFPMDELAGIEIRVLGIALSIYPDEAPRMTTSMTMKPVTQDWNVVELEPGYTGMRWENQPRTSTITSAIAAPVVDPDAPFTEYVIDLLPVYKASQLEYGFALFPDNTRASFNNFASCLGAEDERPILYFEGIHQ